MELDPGSRIAIAEELHLTPPQLTAVVANGRSSTRLLERMMGGIGIDPDIVRTGAPALMQDLAITCALCEDRLQCERNLSEGQFRETLATICPNAGTLNRLAG
jgi:hypothetical protein